MLCDPASSMIVASWPRPRIVGLVRDSYSTHCAPCRKVYACWGQGLRMKVYYKP